MVRDSLPWPVHRSSLRLDGPLDLGLTLSCGQAFRWCLRPDGAYRGVIGSTVVDIWQRGRRELYWESGPRELTEGQLSDYLRLEDDLEFIRLEIGDPRVDASFKAYPGLRLVHQEPWETLISFVVSQMSNVPRICRTVEALATNFGTQLGDGVSNAFPTPGQLSRASEGALRLLGLGYRAPHLVEIANAIADGEVSIEPLREVAYEEARRRLMELPGVGPKVADCTLLFGLDHLEAFPVDRWVARAVVEWYLGGKEMTQERISSWARRHFGRHAGYASQYLFHARRVGGPECPASVERIDLGPLPQDH
jgi:N-glycosylase/DNA lyase